MIKDRLKVLARTAAYAVGVACAASGAEPLCWERVPNRPAPAQFDTFHGETLDFRCTFAGFGALPFSEGADVRLWYQTNGMGAAWWSVPAAVSSNTVTATFPPSADPGAERLAVFFGAPSNAYAAAQVRFRNSPGPHPNDLDPPSVLDWQAELSAAIDALWASSAAAFMPKTNAYTKAETDARIAELAPRTSLAPATNYTDQAIASLPKALTTNDVCNIVTNETQGGWSEWVITPSSLTDGYYVWYPLSMPSYDSGIGAWSMGFDTPEVPGGMAAFSVEDFTSPQDATELHLSAYNYNVTATRTYLPARNALGLARLSDLVAATNAIDVEEMDPYWNAEKGSYATKAALNAVSNEAQVIYRLFSGSNVIDVVTNYNSQTKIPTRKLYQLTDTNTYELVWDEERRHANTLSNANEYAESLGTNYAPRAWSRTTSGLGAEAPDGTTWISSPLTVIAGGYEYEKHITSGGAIWILTSNGSTFDFSPNTNNVAFLNIAATDGTPIFRIEKTDSYLIGVNATGVSTEEPSTLVVELDVVASEHPLVRVCSDIRERNWQKEEDGISSSLATVTWSGSPGSWVCRVQNNTGGNSIFAYFEYLQEGGVKIVNEGQVDLSQGIIVNGVKFAPTVSGTAGSRTLTWTEVQ